MKNVYLEALLRQNQLKFSPKEKKVAHYFMRLGNDIMNKTIAELALEIEVSETTIFNFVKKLGFKGFQQFKIAIATHSQAVINDEEKTDIEKTEAITSADSPQTISEKTFSIYHAYLNQMVKKLEDFSIERLLGCLASVQQLYFFGFDSMVPIADMAARKFIQNGERAYAINETSAQLALSSHLDATDAVFLLTSALTLPSIKTIIQQLYQRQTPMILLTPQTKDPYLARIDFPLLLPMENENVDFKLITHETLALVWIDAIYTSLMAQRT
ncbi:MAG: MurR/RpiR family transcriptional regulator [Aerococcus sp.]|nr:MurR/RpiR family transcriptional regulator [Aerococcus sp.]